MSDQADILEAHVRFELDRWRPGAREAVLADEVAALVTWLDTVTLRDAVPPEVARRWARRAVCEAPLTDGLRRDLEAAVRTGYQRLAEEPSSVGDVLGRAAYDRAVDSLIEMRELRAEIVTQLTTNSAYSQLVSHVLYHGIKGYLLTENVVARKVPGASSLVRFGQHALSAAAPNLERGIDRQLIAFISANVHETIKDSRRYLDAILDDALLRTVAAEVWAANADRTVAEAVGLVGEDTVDDVVSAVWDAWPGLRSAPFVVALVDDVVDGFYRVHGDAPVAALLDAVLDGVGLDRDGLAEEVSLAAGPIVDAALESGFLEARIRGRLETFYLGYFASSTPAPARAKPSRTRRT